MPSRTQGKIDVHHHVYSPTYTAAIENAGGDPSGWYLPSWTVESDTEMRSKTGISTAILSATAPGPEIEKDTVKARQLARAINEFNAQIRDRDPQSYGFFASVPSLLDAQAAIDEMTYALDTLSADGIILMTRYGEDNHYLGHPDFAPVWDFLNERKAVVFVHPTHGVDTHLVNRFIPQPAWDYPHETGRTAIDMITTNMLRDHASNCKIILSHAGGDMPYLIDRPVGLLTYAPSSFNPGKKAEEYVDDARSSYFDTALSSSPMHLKCLMALLGPEGKDHILFGSDFPNAEDEAIKYFTTQLEGQDEVSVQGLRDNALKLFPRLAH